MKTTKLNLLFFSLLLVCSFSLSAQLEVLSNLGEARNSASSVGDPTFGTGFNVFIAQEFTTGNVAYTNGPITVTISISSGSTGNSGNFQVDIYDKTVGGTPGASISTLTGNSNPVPAGGDVEVTYTTGMITLAANTSYYIVASAPFANPPYQINRTTSMGISTAADFTAPHQIQTSGFFGPSTWNAPTTGSRLSFSIELDNTLPVELLGFKGETKEKVNVLEWATASETNNDYFEIQHSRDGENFVALGTENGGGTDEALNNYRFDHENPSAGVHYYRLKQVDFDVRFSYSEIISLEVQAAADQLTLYPNPAREQLTIVNGQGTVFIANTLGQVVQQFNVGENQQTIRIDNLKEGHYFLQVLQPNGEKLRKIFIKE